jgi:2,3,4,5-tetrahydropyridine-2-carboxylate N-succinyltransferase
MPIPEKRRVLIDVIEAAWERRGQGGEIRGDDGLTAAVNEAMDLLDNGEERVADKSTGEWLVNQWLKKAVLMSFYLNDSDVMPGTHSNFFDKVPLKYADFDKGNFEESGVRVVPDALVRKGAYVAPNVVLMPSYVNVGAYVDSGTLVDTWATVGTCAQIGKNVHLSGGVGIGGVLEPVQAGPTIIEDDCFIGARSEIVEGVVVEHGSVISMGVFIGQSTRIYDRASGEISYGRIPAGSVVVSGSLPADDGSHSLYCAVIVKQVDEKTRAKTSLNELIRLAE